MSYQPTDLRGHNATMLSLLLNLRPRTAEMQNLKGTKLKIMKSAPHQHSS